jgi:AraC-like DNA-binding protein
MGAIGTGAITVDRLHVRIFTVHETFVHDWWRERGVCSAYWRYYVNSSDGASVRLADGELYQLPAGQLHFIPAGIRFDLVPPSRPIAHLYSHFDVVGLPGTVVRELFARPCSLPLDPVLRATCERMRAAVRDPLTARLPQSLLDAKAAIHLGLAALFAGLDRAPAERLAAVLRADSPLAPALRRIDEDPTRPLRVAALARLCGYAEAHFARLFRRELGQSPGQYVLERRVALAAQRLVMSDEDIEGIAEACGFPDRFYFTRVFTRRMGMPPATYRRAQPRNFDQVGAPRTGT